VESGVTDDLNEFRSQITEVIDNLQKERRDAELHRDYYDGKQWTADEIAILEKRGQPVITDNKIKDKVEYMEGVERKTRTDPKAFPRTQVHEEDADVATDSIRYVFDKNRFPQVKSRVFNNLLIEGFGGCEVVVDKEKPQEVLIRYWRWDRLYRDPYSMEPDCSDAQYVGGITWMDVERAKSKWKGKDAILEQTLSQAPSRASGDTTDDKPRWVDSKRKRVQVFEHYSRQAGKIMRSVFVWGGFLEEPKECPYVNDEDEHEWPLIMASAYIDREGNRYGLVKRYVSLQDELNKRRSKSLHLLQSKQLIATKGAFDDINEARKELHKPDGVLEPNTGAEWEIEKNLDLSAAHFQLLVQADQALAATGPNSALLGTSGAISGVAKARDQEGGALQIGVLFDAIRDWQLRVARAVWNRIRQYWDQEMWIRVTDDERGLKFVALNQPVLQGDVMAQQLKGRPPEEIQAGIAQIAQDPRSKMPVMEDGKPKIRNEVAKLDVDIIIDEAPDVVTVQTEEFEKIALLAQTGKVPIPPDVLIEASQLRSQTKKRIMDKLSGANDPAAQQAAQMQQMLARMELMLKEAEVRRVNAQAGKDEAATVESQVDASVKIAEFTSPQPQGAEGQPGKSGAKTQVSVN
jgi:hypothetical protein